MPPNVRKQFKDVETQLFSEDTQILDHKAIKNELESFSYDMRNSISEYGPLEKYIEPTLRD